MDKDEVAHALKRLAARPVPNLAADFEQRVRREIRLRKDANMRDPIWDVLVAAFVRPGWGLSALAMTLVVAVGFGAIEVAAPPRTAPLFVDVKVFSADAPSLPSTLLARSP